MSISEAEQHAALERFVVDNDDLLALEEHLGRFNVFDALRIARVEIRHSNFLAWLLDPAESHGLGTMFLKAVLMDLLRAAPQESRPLSPVILDGADLRGVLVRREWRNIDILITCEYPRFAVVVENKIDSGEHGPQLGTYAAAASKLGYEKVLHIFLTKDRSDASDDRYISYGYAELFQTLARCRRTYDGAIGGDVRVVMDHYLSLIGSRFMPDPKIVELCQKIYRNHRQAIDLIIENVGAAGGGVLHDIASHLRDEPDRWQVFNVTGRRLEFAPAGWSKSMPPIVEFSRKEPLPWLFCWFYRSSKSLRLYVEAGKLDDAKLRTALIERLTEDPKEFGFAVKGAQVTPRWTRLMMKRVVDIDEDSDPDLSVVMPAVQRELQELLTKLDRLPQLVTDLIARRRHTPQR